LDQDEQSFNHLDKTVFSVAPIFDESDRRDY